MTNEQGAFTRLGLMSAEAAAGVTEMAAQVARVGTRYSPPPFDPTLSRQVMDSQGLVPVASDGSTHYPTGTAFSGGACGATSGQGLRLSLNWALVDCDACRDGAQL